MTMCDPKKAFVTVYRDNFGSSRRPNGACFRDEVVVCPTCGRFGYRAPPRGPLQNICIGCGGLALSPLAELGYYRLTGTRIPSR